MSELERETSRQRIRLIRGYILRAMAGMYPNPTMRSTIQYVLRDLEPTEKEISQEVAYLKVRGWIETKDINLTGKPDLRIALTAAGYDVAQGINPEKPFAPEEG